MSEHKFRLRGLLATVLMAVSIAACGGADPEAIADAEEAAAAPTVSVDTGLEFLRGREVYLPQVAGGGDSPVYVVWSERAEERGSNLFISRRGEAGVFEPQVQINDEPGTPPPPRDRGSKGDPW